MYYNMSPCCYPRQHSGNTFAIIIVLFILLAIIGAWTIGY